jgi:hypothetical protein
MAPIRESRRPTAPEVRLALTLFVLCMHDCWLLHVTWTVRTTCRGAHHHDRAIFLFICVNINSYIVPFLCFVFVPKFAPLFYPCVCVPKRYQKFTTLFAFRNPIFLVDDRFANIVFLANLATRKCYCRQFGCDTNAFRRTGLTNPPNSLLHNAKSFRFSSRNFEQSELAPAINEFTLNAGDLAYFPRGVVHQVRLHCCPRGGTPLRHTRLCVRVCVLVCARAQMCT